MIKYFKSFSDFRKLNHLLRFHISTKEQFIQKLANKQYLQILGLQSQTNLFKDKDLHRAYLTQIKKFHSDNVQSEATKKQFEEITKCIINAYDQLRKSDKNYSREREQQALIFKEEETIAQELFGKRYTDIKHTLYTPGNEEMRAKFLQELKKKKNVRKDDDFPNKTAEKSRQSSSNYYSPPSQSSNNSLVKLLGLIFVCGLALFPFLKSTKPSKQQKQGSPVEKQVKIRQFDQQQMDIIHLNSQKILSKPFEQFLNTIFKRRPHMLAYPLERDPNIIQQLAKYSIASDIHLYQVPSKYLLDEKQVTALKVSRDDQRIQKYQLTHTKPNTLLTLSLEAERALHNVYVSVDDVLKEISQKGKFTPPKVFFKYYGYIMVQIRDKPFCSLQNYKNSKYISLFDLYFDYYSPIFFKRDHFTQYAVGIVDDSPLKNNRYFGHVHLNYRQIPKRYLQPNQKIVVLKDIKRAYDPDGKLKLIELKYQTDWQRYYARYEKNWTKYCSHQRQGKVIY